MQFLKLVVLIFATWYLSTSAVFAQNHEGNTVIMRGNIETADPDKLKWDRNRFVPWGMTIIVIHGDPSKEGPYTFRVRMPTGYKLPPHRHRDERTVTVLKGTYWTGTGDSFDMRSMDMMEAGSFYITDPDVAHYAWARTEVILQESGYGPTDMRWLNPEDDPNY